MASTLAPGQPTQSTKPFNVNPSPGTRFRASNDNISKHRDLVDSREFQRALDFAKLEMLDQITRGRPVQGMNDYAIMGLEMVGAMHFCDILLHLSEQPMPPKMPPAAPPLDHKA